MAQNAREEIKRQQIRDPAAERVKCWWSSWTLRSLSSPGAARPPSPYLHQHHRGHEPTYCQDRQGHRVSFRSGVGQRSSDGPRGPGAGPHNVFSPPMGATNCLLLTIVTARSSVPLTHGETRRCDDHCATRRLTRGRSRRRRDLHPPRHQPCRATSAPGRCLDERRQRGVPERPRRRRPCPDRAVVARGDRHAVLSDAARERATSAGMRQKEAVARPLAPRSAMSCADSAPTAGVSTHESSAWSRPRTALDPPSTSPIVMSCGCYVTWCDGVSSSASHPARSRPGVTRPGRAGR